MELVIFIVSRREQLVSRRDIVTKLWRSDLFIDTEPNINNIVQKSERLWAITRPNRASLTLVGKGYRFIGPVQVIDACYPKFDFEHRYPIGIGRERSSGWGECSSLAVPPLFLVGTVTDDQALGPWVCRCTGFAPWKSARCGRFADFVGTECADGSDASDIASRLGVRFVVHGAIRESKGQLRVSLEMFETHLQSPCFTRKCHLDVNRHSYLEDEIAKQIAGALNRPFMRNHARLRLSSSGDPALPDDAAQHLINAVTRDPAFALAHATLSFVCADASLRVRSSQPVAGEGGVSLPSRAGKWIRIYPKDTSPMLFCYGDPPRTFSILQRLHN
jgi:hypothetical protein